MKRISTFALMIALLLGVSITSIGAEQMGTGSSWASISVGPEWQNYQYDMNGYTYKLKETLLGLHADGANYFGDSSAFGIGYTYGYKFFLKQNESDTEGTSIGDVNLSDTYPWMKLQLTANYRYCFSDSLSLEAGVGGFFQLFWKNYYDSGASTKYRYYVMDYGLAARIEAAYNFSNEVSIHLGANAQLPLGLALVKENRRTDSSRSATGTSVTGFSIYPFVALAFRY